MTMRPWQRELRRRLRLSTAASRRPRGGGQGRHGLSPVFLTLLTALLLAGAIIGLLEYRLRPVVATLAQTQAQNTMTAVLEQAITADLAQRSVSYASLVTIQRDEAGTITALTTDMAAMNLLRAALVSEVLTILSEIDVSEIQVPLGSLFDSELIWARGPVLRARSMSVGTVSAEFESEFSSAGVNQTLHRIWLELSVPISVLLPVGRIEVPVDTRLCIAETVIVGQVPDTYLQLGMLPASS